MSRRKISDEKRAEVLRLLRMGWTTTLIASELHISSSSVQNIGKSFGAFSAYKGGKIKADDGKTTAQKRADEEAFTRMRGGHTFYDSVWDRED